MTNISALQSATAKSAQNAKELGVITPELFAKLTDGTVSNMEFEAAKSVLKDLHSQPAPDSSKLAAAEDLVDKAGAQNEWFRKNILLEDAKPGKLNWFTRLMARIFWD